MRPVVLIGHADWETFGVAPATLEAAEIPWIEHLAHASEALPSPNDVSAILVFGGDMNVDMIDRYPFLEREREFIGVALETGIPYLGICLGGQMLARALDHPVHSAGVREIGFKPLHPTEEGREDPLFSVFEDADTVFHWHQDWFDLPEGATLLATGDEVPTQSFRYGDRAWGTQFHFEIDRAELDLWLKTAGEEAVRAWGSSVERIRTEGDHELEQHEARARELLRRFWELVHDTA
ncbi:MAG TPA: type 1 glutamine amidotransferase [Actinomycetota bacterium]|nr:type 1 glutamine amidotransferase [Actinomycetota bacterium]